MPGIEARSSAADRPWRRWRRRGAMVRAIEREDLLPPGNPRDLDRILVGFGAAVGEEERVDVAGRDVASFAPSFARDSVAMKGWRSSTATCSAMALTTRASPWPMFTHINWLLKSR